MIRKKKTTQEKIAEYEARGNHWLAEANLAAEQGKRAKEEKCLEKGQFWLDKANKARGSLCGAPLVLGAEQTTAQAKSDQRAAR